jgi:hypothetical protein
MMTANLSLVQAYQARAQPFNHGATMTKLFANIGKLGAFIPLSAITLPVTVVLAGAIGFAVWCIFVIAWTNDFFSA